MHFFNDKMQLLKNEPFTTHFKICVKYPNVLLTIDSALLRDYNVTDNED